MSLHDLNRKIKKIGKKPSTGYVRQKMKKYNANPKNAAGRTRARKNQWAASIAKVVKRAGRIADLMTADDQSENLRVIREAKHATHKIYDQAKKKLVDVPDTKSRLAAVILDLAYSEGKPQENSTVLHVFEELGDVVRKIQASPAMQAALGGFQSHSLQNTTKSSESVVEGEFTTEGKPEKPDG